MSSKFIHVVACDRISFLKKRFYLFIFRERGKKGEGKGEIIHVRKKHRLVASRTPPTGDLACIPGMCPDWESNQRPFGSHAGAQSTELPQPGLFLRLHSISLYVCTTFCLSVHLSMDVWVVFTFWLW